MSCLPKYQCQVCGKEAEPEVVAVIAQHAREFWVVHRIELVGGVINIMTCPSCATLTQSLIFETYKERIRSGFVPGFH